MALVKKADGVPGNIHSDLLPANHQKISNNKLFYPEIYPGIDMFYSVGSDRAKEDIVIQNRPIPNEATGFSFKFHAPGLTYEKLPDGSIVFKSRMNGQSLFLLAKPFMYDSSIPVGYQANPGVTDVPEGSRSDAVSMKIVQRGSNFFIDLVPDQAWLNAPERLYPVTIDPTIIKYQPDATTGIDTNMRSYFPTQTGGSDTTLGVGLYQDANQSNRIRSLFKFDLSSIPQGASILDATLNLWMASVTNNTSIGVEVHKVTRAWTESGANWNTSDGTTAWTTPGGDFNATPETTVTGIGPLLDLSFNITFDITTMVANWVQTPSSNLGMLLKSNSETTNTVKKFTSSDDVNNPNNRPMLAVTYYPGSRLGLERFWTYDSHNLTNGVSHTNMTTGNNVVQYTDVFLPGRGLGTEFTRTYNSKDVTDGPLGYGWSFTGGQSIVEKPGVKAIYTDRDGTAHVFTWDGVASKYVAPAGTYLDLVKTGTTVVNYTITYKNGTKLTFDSTPDNNTGVQRGKLLSIQDRHGNTVSYGYDANGKLTSITDPTGRVTNLAYYPSGRISSITDFAGRATSYGYDVSGNLIQVTDPLNQITYLTYNASHQLTRIQDPNGRLTDFTYTAENLTKVQEPDRDAPDQPTRPGTSYSYDLVNHTSTATDRNGNVTSYHSNGNYVIDKITDPLNRVNNLILDSNHNVTQITDPKGGITTNTYDANGNLTSTSDPLGNQTSATYNASNDRLTFTDALGRITSFSYNSAGDLLSVTDPAGKITSYSYDAYGNRFSTTDANNNTTSYSYDANGNLSSETDAAGRTISYNYDAAGNLFKVIDSNNQVTQVDFNAVDQPTSIKDFDSPTAIVPTKSLDLGYDANGNNTGANDNVSGNSSYSYNGTNNVQGQTIPNQPIINYGYDANENLTSFSGIGPSLNFSYDGANQLTAVLNGTGGAIANYSYDLTGNITGIARTWANADGVSQSVTYDAANRVTGVTNKDVNLNVLFSFSYTYDTNGRVTGVTDNTGASISYAYDVTGRLQSYNDSTGTTSYTYDGVGNRLTKTAPNGTTNYTYNNLNQLAQRSGTDGNATYTYDAAGHLISKGGYIYTWGVDGKLAKVTNPDGSCVEFIYNAAGQRVEKIVKNPAGAVTADTKYQYDNTSGNLLAEIDAITNTTKITYSYDSRGRIFMQQQGGSNYYYNYDGHGNVVSITDWWGSTVVSYRYDPWGKLVSKTGTLYNPITYSGYYYDEETGLYYLINRYYDPVDGRFLSRDAKRDVERIPDTINPYVYTNNDPINNVDPDGDFFVLAAPLAYEGVVWLIGAITVAYIASQYPYDSLPGSLKREFPGEYRESTLEEIQRDAQKGIKQARKALKLIKEGGKRLLDKVKSGGKRR
ncbi:MAG: DNRLRE domain-containing protein [Clostridia bacterium]|nr:DNRLRE domain-containing protein [Clostridia bacterium]